METKIKKIVTHFRPHADELVARMILRRFPQGEKKYPGVSLAPTEFLTTGELPQGKTASDFPDTIFLGCGGGLFDEHATSKKDREEDQCCASLVVRELGLEENLAVQKIIYFIKREDLGGSKIKNELPMIIKILHQAYPKEQEKIARFAEDAYFADYEEEKEFFENLSKDSNFDEVIKNRKKDWQPLTLESGFNILKKRNPVIASDWKKFADDALVFKQKRFEDAKNEFQSKGELVGIQTKTKGKILMATIDSDNEEMNKYARFIGAHVVVQRNSRGNYIIMTDRKRKFNISFMFVLLRLAEQHYRGEIKIKDESLLSKEGFVDGVPCWYLFHTRDMGFNGSLTTKDVEPTKIPAKKVIEIIKTALERE